MSTLYTVVFSGIVAGGLRLFLSLQMAKESLFDQVDLPKLKTTIDADARTLEVFKENLVDHVREFCGGHYSDRPGIIDPNNPTNPVNLIALFQRIIVDQLVPSDPRFLASTFITQLRPYKAIYEDWGNRKLLKIGFADILRSAIVDAIYLAGFVKVALTAPAEARFGYGKVVGEATIENIPFQRMIFDTTVNKFKDCDYVGYEYDVFYEDLKKSTLYDKKAKLQIVPVDDKATDREGVDKIEQIGRGGMSRTERYYEKARLCEIWLRRENLVVTFDAEGDCERPLLVQEWVGPACGPFRMLSLGDVLGNLIPKGPICDLIDMHREFNLLWKKMGNQASDQKTVYAYRDKGDAQRIKEAADRDYVHVDDPSKIVPVTSPGPDTQVFNYSMASYNLFKQFAGNLDSIAGLGTQADTATQEKLVHASASGMVAALSGRVQAFANNLMGMDGIGWFWWNSPRQEMKASFQAPGVPDVSIDRNLTPQKRFGIQADEIDIQVDVYSFVRETPQARARDIDELMGLVLKFFPMFNQAGIGAFLAECVKLKGKYKNNPDFQILLEKLMGVEGPPADQPEEPNAGMPEETTRTYERISRPGMTDQGNMQAIMQRMAGGEMAGPGDQQQLGQMRAG